MNHDRHGFNVYKLQPIIEGCCFSFSMFVFVMCIVQGPLTVRDLGFDTSKSRCHLMLIAHYLVLTQQVG
jgi:hypothetical protein